MDKVIATIPTGKPVEGSLSPVPYFHLLERLKTTKREGWRRFGITRYGNPHGLALPGAEQGKKKKKEKRLTEGATRGRRGESIADHMYRMAMMTMLAPPSLVARIDRDRCIKMCLVHDMAESLVGDITPVDGVPRTEKHAREAATMDFLAKRLLPNVDGGAAGREIQEVWDEYEKSETLESKFVHDIDKMELLFQMVEYEKRAEGAVDLGEFAYVATNIVLPETKAWADELLKEREAFWGSRAHLHGDEGVAGGIPADLAGMQAEYYNEEQAGKP